MEVPMRQRGAQSRRERPGGDLGTFGAPLGSGGRSGDRFWPTVAMIAIVIATAGWTTVAVLVLSSGSPAGANPSSSQIAAASPSDDLGLAIEPDSSDSPEPESHVSPALEAVLPKTAGATALTTQSWTGATLLSDDGWSNAFTAFLQSVGKTSADLLIAQGYDQTGNIDLTVAAFKISGVSAADVRKTLVNAWKADYPELATTSETVGGKKVTKGVFQDTGIDSYWYEHEDLVYDVETADSDLAATVLAALP
jgi:hypothetical protein